MCFQGSGNTHTHIVNTDTPMGFHKTTKAQWFRMFKLCTINKGSSKPSFDMNIDRKDLLSMDPPFLQWKTCEDYLSYTSAMGRNILQARNPLLRSIVVKWHGIIPPRLNFKWGNLWDKMCSKNEGAFIWSI